MKYGLNFGEEHIDAAPGRTLFQTRMTIHQENENRAFYLQGIATTEQARDEMVLQVDNGTRRIHVEARNHPSFAGAKIYGIYIF